MRYVTVAALVACLFAVGLAGEPVDAKLPPSEAVAMWQNTIRQQEARMLETRKNIARNEALANSGNPEFALASAERAALGKKELGEQAAFLTLYRQQLATAQAELAAQLHPAARIAAAEAKVAACEATLAAAKAELEAAKLAAAPSPPAK